MRSGEVIKPDGKGGAMVVPDYATILEEARHRYEMYEETVGRLQDKVRELQDEAYVDRRLGEMEQQLQDARRAMSRGFAITDDEWDDIHAWQQQHMMDEHGIDIDRDHGYGGAIGGSWRFSFVPTSIGVIGTVSCFCGAEHTFQELS